MTNQFNYAFDDEVVSKFCYDIDNNKRIDIFFTGYIDLIENQYFSDRPCTFIIEDWQEAKSQIGDDPKRYPLDRHMGIFSLILYMKLQEDKLEMMVNTLDERFITLIFKEPKIRLQINDNETYE